MEFPTEDELRDRITRQVAWRGPTDTVVLLWRGYLAGIFEWGLIDLAVFGRLTALLPPKGNKELDELFGGEPNTPVRDKEIDEYLTSRSKQ